MPEDLPPLVEVNGVRAHLVFWLKRPDGWWGGLRRLDSWPQDMIGFGSRKDFVETLWYAHADVISIVTGYENRKVKRYGG
jgi:hypothetical protein